MSAKHQAKALSQPASKASAVIMTEGLRETLSKAYANKFGAGRSLLPKHKEVTSSWAQFTNTFLAAALAVTA